MLKATIDRNENACVIELMGDSLELSGDLCVIIKNFMNCFITKHTKDEARKIVKIACAAGISLALEENE